MFNFPTLFYILFAFSTHMCHTDSEKYVMHCMTCIHSKNANAFLNLTFLTTQKEDFK